MKEIPLTKTLQPEDFKLLARPLGLVDLYKNSASPQHEMRRWEYAMVLEAHARWVMQAPTHAVMQNVAIDVGGAGSPLAALLTASGLTAMIIDPASNYPLERILEKKPLMQASVVTCISVIEHVPAAQLEHFLLALGKIVLPGGLLFITTDFTENAAEDNFHFHWMRSQIFDREKLTVVAQQLARESNLQLFGGVDDVYHGATVYDYTFASLCLTKQEAAR